MARQLSAVHCHEEEHAGCSTTSCCSFMKRKLGLHTLRELGEGGQGIVFLCTDEAHSVRLACKTIRSHAKGRPDPTSRQINQHGSKKRKLNATDAADVHQSDLLSSSSRTRKLSAEEVWEDTQLRWEAEVLHHLKGIPGILPLVCTFDGDDSCFHLLTAFCDAGDLLSKLLDSPPPLFKLSQQEAAPIVASLAHTLAVCHARGVVHRDIKPGNILFRRVQGNDGEEVVLADFGFAATITPGETLCERVGTPRYQAPEVIQGRYDHRADVWSLGVVIHLLLTSTLPFTDHLHHDAPDEAIYHAILCNKLQLEGLELSSSAEDLLRRILCKDPSARLTLEEILCHPWLLQHNNNMEPNVSATASLKAHTNSAGVTEAPLVTGSSTPSPSKHGVIQHTVAGFNEFSGSTTGAPKIKRARLPMGRKCFRQQWANAVAKAAVA